MPSTDTTAQILQNIAQAQQERIKALNAARVSSAVIPGQGLQNLTENFLSGRKRVAEEQAEEDQSQLRHAQLAQAQFELKKGQSEEDALDEVDPQDETGLGRTFRQERIAMGAATSRQNLKLNAQSAADTHAATAAQIRQADASHSLAVRQTLNGEQATKLDNYEKEREGLAMLPAGPERDQKVAQLNQKYINAGVPAESITARSDGKQGAVDMLKSQSAMAKEQLFQLSEPGQTLHNAVSSAQNDTTNLQSMVDLYNKYNSSHKVPGFDELGSVNEQETGKDAREEFARVLESQGHHSEAAGIRDNQVPWNTVADQMKNSITKGITATKSNWNSNGKARVPAQYTAQTLPNGQPNPDYKASVGTVDTQLSNLEKALSGGGAGGMPSVNSINPLTGSAAPTKSVKDAIAARRAQSGQQGPVAAPATAPQAAPGSMPTQPLAPNIIIPDNDPMLGN